MSTELTTIDTADLEIVTGGAGANVNVDIKGEDIRGTVQDVGNGAARLLGCATGASSLREFGNCMLTGKLGDVPPAPQPAAPAGGN